MKFKIMYPVIVFALLLILGHTTDHLAAKTPDGPKTFLSDTKYNFGEVHDGETVRHHFIVKNSGTTPLTIIDVKTD